MTRVDPTPEAWGQPLGDSREFAMLAHDIKGALQGVIGGISLIAGREVPDELRPQVDRVSAAAQALASLVADAVGDAGAGGGAARPGAAADEGGSVEIEGFLDFQSRRWSGEAHAKGLDFHIEPASDLPERLAAGFLPLARVVGNLVGNAIKYADRGTVRLLVRHDATGALEFAVQDDGPGIADADAGRAFEYGFRARASGGAGGGVGLHIAKALTERMGGTIALANRLEGGVEAVVRFPGRLCTAAPAGGNGGEGMPDLAGLHILLAEDNLTNQMVASQMLRSLNARVTLASDGLEALQRFEAGAFDVVVVDIEMPRLSGVDVIRTIRSRGDGRATTPIVALTAYAMHEHRARIADAGADGLISKPIVSIEGFGRAVLDLARPPEAQPPAAVPPAPAGAEPLIDAATFAALRETIGPEMMGELLERVVADLEAAERGLSAALGPRELEAIRSVSHILISVAGAIGAVRLQRRARSLNTLAHRGDPDGIDGESRACLAEIAAAVRFARDQRALA